MTFEELQQQVALGEDSRRQFKVDCKNAVSLGSEMVAFSNSRGGQIFIGVSDVQTIVGLEPDDVRRINQLIANAATGNVRSPINPVSENIDVGNGRVVIVLTVAKGIDKPYFDTGGVIWLKAGSDKRRVQSREELRRLFQEVDLINADGVPTQASIDALDRTAFAAFHRAYYDQEAPVDDQALIIQLQNMNLAVNGCLNLAGLLLFGKNPQAIRPAFLVKAVRYPGDDISANQYLDNEDIEGPLALVFKNTVGFLRRNLPRLQIGGSVNSPGHLQIPEIVLEELVANALTHRDYFIQAPIRVFMFDNRIEIVSPGILPNHLTVEKIQAGNSVIRNPILTSFASKGLIPYRGLGTGIRRVIHEWPECVFVDDRHGCTFTAILNLKNKAGEPIKPKKYSLDEQNGPIIEENEPLNEIVHTADEPKDGPIGAKNHLLLQKLKANPEMTLDEMSVEMEVSRSTVKRWIDDLREQEYIRRSGSKKDGHWEILKDI